MAETVLSHDARAEAVPDPLSAYLREVERTRMPTRPEEKALLGRIGRGDHAARNALITANLKIVVAICGRYRDLGLPFADLIAEGNLGLIRAAQSYDVARGRFAPYAEWWIRRSVARALEEQARFRPGIGPRAAAEDGNDGAMRGAPGALPRIHARGNR